MKVQVERVNILKYVEINGALAILVGWVFKALEMGGFEVILISGWISLVIVYSIFGFVHFNEVPVQRIFQKDAYQGIPPFRFVMAILVGVVMSLAITGILNKIMGWNGGMMLLKMALPCLLGLIVVGLYMGKDTADSFYKYLLMRMALAGMIAFQLLIMKPA